MPKQDSFRQYDLSNGLTTLISERDYQWMRQWKWWWDGTSVVREDYKTGKRKKYYLHNELMRTPKGMETDHKNGDHLDNRRENLRVCTKAQNMSNRRRNTNNTSGYKGVYWNIGCNKWIASLRHNQKFHHLGVFDTAYEASKAYDAGATKYFGEFARLNHA